ncbi:MAG: hypothetical protein AB7L66_12170 [Gemmatimonadales bacterium]
MKVMSRVLGLFGLTAFLVATGTVGGMRCGPMADPGAPPAQGTAHGHHGSEQPAPHHDMPSCLCLGICHAVAAPPPNLPGLAPAAAFEPLAVRMPAAPLLPLCVRGYLLPHALPPPRLG